MKKPRYLVNEQIRLPSMLVIDQDGKNMGELSKQEALALAEEQGLDLVLFANMGDKPVAKIIDYGKFVYNTKKKTKQSKKNQTQVKNKEIKVKGVIATHDLEVRAKSAKEWLQAGHRVRFVILAYGRMGSKPELIQETYKKFMEMVGDVGMLNQPLKKISRVMYEAILVFNKK